MFYSVLSVLFSQIVHLQYEIELRALQNHFTCVLWWVYDFIFHNVWMVLMYIVVLSQVWYFLLIFHHRFAFSLAQPDTTAVTDLEDIKVKIQCYSLLICLLFLIKLTASLEFSCTFIVLVTMKRISRIKQT